MDIDLVMVSMYTVTCLFIIIFAGAITMLVDYINRPEEVTCFYCNNNVLFENAYESKIAPDHYICKNCKNKLKEEV